MCDIFFSICNAIYKHVHAYLDNKSVTRKLRVVDTM